MIFVSSFPFLPFPLHLLPVAVVVPVVAVDADVHEDAVAVVNE